MRPNQVKKNALAKLVRQARRSLGLNGDSQQDLLRRARDTLELTNEELAEAIGVKLPTLYAYLAPKSAAKHRALPADMRLILEKILRDHNGRKRG